MNEKREEFKKEDPPRVIAGIVTELSKEDAYYDLARGLVGRVAEITIEGEFPLGHWIAGAAKILEIGEGWPNSVILYKFHYKELPVIEITDMHKCDAYQHTGLVRPGNLGIMVTSKESVLGEGWSSGKVFFPRFNSRSYLLGFKYKEVSISDYTKRGTGDGEHSEGAVPDPRNASRQNRERQDELFNYPAREDSGN